jgi:predicted enzyme related to lactoylglutathione lyase
MKKLRKCSTAVEAQEVLMNPVVHFEMPAEDRKRMADFYTRVFGWRTQMLGPDMGSYVVVTTTELDKNGRPKKPGSINGGFFQKSNDKPDQYPAIVIAVDDIKKHMEKVKEAGGELLGEPMEIPGVGLYVSSRDTEGNRIAMLQPLSVMQVRPK